MSLAHAILVCLSDEPMTGYDLAKRFDSSVGFFWRANHQQIYRELGLLGEKKWVKGKLIAQASRPDKTVFNVTRLGLARLKAWSKQEAAPAAIKEELLLKFYALDKVDLPALMTQLAARVVLHTERLALYEKILARHFADESALSLAAKGKLLGLKAGMNYERQWIASCTDALRVLAEHSQ